jgi:hypothetical protein
MQTGKWGKRGKEANKEEGRKTIQEATWQMMQRLVMDRAGAIAATLYKSGRQNSDRNPKWFSIPASNVSQMLVNYSIKQNGARAGAAVASWCGKAVTGT